MPEFENNTNYLKELLNISCRELDTLKKELREEAKQENNT